MCIVNGCSKKMENKEKSYNQLVSVNVLYRSITSGTSIHLQLYKIRLRAYMYICMLPHKSQKLYRIEGNLSFLLVNREETKESYPQIFCVPRGMQKGEQEQLLSRLCVRVETFFFCFSLIRIDICTNTRAGDVHATVSHIIVIPTYFFFCHCILHIHI